MTTATEPPVTLLDASECWQLLAGCQLGRLATSVADQPEIFPINYAVHDGVIYFRTAEGTKLVSTLINDKVAFEVDQYDRSSGWSVIVTGVAREVTHTDELRTVDSLGLKSWVSETKHRHVRIDAGAISGRRFVFGEEPEDVPGIDPPD